MPAYRVRIAFIHHRLTIAKQRSMRIGSSLIRIDGHRHDSCAVQIISRFPTLAVTLNGKGDIEEASVIGGTAARPLSDAVYVRMV